MLLEKSAAQLVACRVCHKSEVAVNRAYVVLEQLEAGSVDLSSLHPNAESLCATQLIDKSCYCAIAYIIAVWLYYLADEFHPVFRRLNIKLIFVEVEVQLFPKDALCFAAKFENGVLFLGDHREVIHKFFYLYSETRAKGQNFLYVETHVKVGFKLACYVAYRQPDSLRVIEQRLVRFKMPPHLYRGFSLAVFLRTVHQRDVRQFYQQGFILFVVFSLNKWE